MDMLETFASLRLADSRLAACGYPAGDIAKGGSLTMRTAALAGDIAKRMMTACVDLQQRLDRLGAQFEAVAQRIAELEAADRANEFRALFAQPRGRA